METMEAYLQRIGNPPPTEPHVWIDWEEHKWRYPLPGMSTRQTERIEAMAGSVPAKKADDDADPPEDADES